MNKKVERLISYFMIITGAVIASFSVACILLPNDAIDYGTAGIAIIISKLSGWNLSVCVTVVFFPFWVMGVKILGKQFGLRAFLGMGCI